MKQFIIAFIIALAGVSAYGQRMETSGTIAGDANDTVQIPFWSTGAWSVHFWYESLDDVDGTLAVYGSNFHKDSLAFVDFEVDSNNDSLDLPKTLSDTATVIWGDHFPFRYLIIKYLAGSNSAGNVYYNALRQ
jgi:hypothetical protein